MKAEVRRAVLWGLLVTAILTILIVIGSRNLEHFDAALVGYTFAVLFSTFGITYRYATWLQRPPTAMYWRRGWQAFFSRKYWRANIGRWLDRAIGDFALNRFIWRRAKTRWMAHWLIMWGCAIAVIITFPLVFGWIYFETAPGDLSRYRMFVFGFPVFSFPYESFLGFMIFHGLDWSAFLVIAGVMLAMRRRMRDHGAVAIQNFGEDFLPLILLFAVSITGLMLTASYTWMKGYAYDFLAILHAVIVIFTLLFLSFGKFFHIFQRPAQLGASFYKDVGVREEQAQCRRCGEPFTSLMHVEDLIRVERELRFHYEMEGSVGHYQWICPPCRRALVALAQGRLFHRQRDDFFIREAQPPYMARPVYANPAPGEGPLGDEDRDNFHP